MFTEISLLADDVAVVKNGEALVYGCLNTLITGVRVTPKLFNIHLNQLILADVHSFKLLCCHKLQAGREIRTIYSRLLVLCQICKAYFISHYSIILFVSDANALDFLFQFQSCVSKALCYYKNPGMIVKDGSISCYFPYCIRSGKHVSSQLPVLLQVMFLQITLSLYLCCFLLFRKAVKTQSLLSRYSESQT